MEFIQRFWYLWLPNGSFRSEQRPPKETKRFLQKPRPFNGVRVSAKAPDANVKRLRKHEIMRKERKVRHGREVFQSGVESA